jgi:hypothetical protein
VPEKESSQPASAVSGELVPAAKSEIVADPLAWLAPAERYAYDYFLSKQGRGGSETYPIAESACEGLFNLYLNGKTLAEIRTYAKQFGFGQVVHAAVRGQWNLLRAAYMETVTARSQSRAKQGVAEAVEFTVDLMTALRTLHTDNIARYLQTRNPIDLGASTSMGVIRQLKELSEVLSKLTGQDQNKRVSGTIKHEVTGTVTTVPTAAPPPMAPGEAQAMLGAWAADATERQRRERTG